MTRIRSGDGPISRGVEELGVTCLGCFWHRAFFRWEDDGRPVEMFSDLASQALEAKCVRIAQLAAAVWCAANAALLFFRAWLDLDAARGFDELYADLIAAGAPSIAEAWAPRIAMYAAFGLLWLGLTVWGVRGGAHAPEMARAQRRTARSRIDPPGKETTMNDVKKTWCGPVYTLDPEKMERQFNRLSAEGWQLEGTGWLSFRYRRGAPNEYRYRVQYLYESRDGQRDDYVRGSRELRFFMRFLQDKHERMSGRERQKRVAFSGEKTIINYQCATSVVHSA